MKKYLFLLSALFILGCHSQSPAPKTKPLVVVTYSPYAYFVKRIAGPTLDVQSLIPPGANPHTFSLSMKEVKLAYDADLWFSLGKTFEKKLFSVTHTHNPQLITLDLCQNTDLLDNEEEGLIWLSPKIVKMQIQHIAEKLITHFPENQNFYKENLRNFLTDLDKLDTDIRSLLDDISVRSILISYPAMAYFCRDYFLEQISFEADQSSLQLPLVLQFAKEKNITHALVQPHKNNQGIQAVAHILDIPVKMIDPFAENYLTNMRHIAETIANL